MYTPKKAYFYGTGRRKSSVARVRLIPGGTGEITINNRKIDLKRFKDDILIPMKNDGLDPYRKEYNDMLLEKLAESDDIIQENIKKGTIKARE